MPQLGSRWLSAFPVACHGKCCKCGKWCRRKSDVANVPAAIEQKNTTDVMLVIIMKGSGDADADADADDDVDAV